MSSNLTKQWQVLVRFGKSKPWKARRGLFETRAVAREKAAELRDPYGFGNTTAVRYVKGQK